MAEPDPLRELERQVERGNLFAHTALTEQAQRANENEAIVNGLVNLLIQHDLVLEEELLEAVKSVRKEIADAGAAATVGVAVRVDAEGPAQPAVEVDCEARLHVCKAVCCRLHFALTVEEIESGPMKWDLGRPYYNRHGADGYCHQSDGETHACGIYGERPPVCRAYSCAGDARIWTDFDAMELNQEWIDEHLGNDELGPVEIFMDSYDNG